MRPLLPLAAIAAVVALAVPVTAFEQCHGDPYLLSWEDPVTGHLYYVANDACQPDCVFSTWVYIEDNGVPGLQRCDDVHGDNCETGEPGCAAGSDFLLF